MTARGRQKCHDSMSDFFSYFHRPISLKIAHKTQGLIRFREIGLRVKGHQKLQKVFLRPRVSDFLLVYRPILLKIAHKTWHHSSVFATLTSGLAFSKIIGKCTISLNSRQFPGRQGRGKYFEVGGGGKRLPESKVTPTQN